MIHPYFPYCNKNCLPNFDISDDNLLVRSEPRNTYRSKDLYVLWVSIETKVHRKQEVMWAERREKLGRSGRAVPWGLYIVLECGQHSVGQGDAVRGLYRL